MSRLTSWLSAIAWAGLIASMSTDTFSKDHTSLVILPLLHFLLPRATPEGLDTLHFLIRKSAHLFEYFVFGMLLFRAVRSPARGWNVRWAASALFLAAMYAASDEFHQVFVPSRGPSVYDALLDTVAAAAAQLVLWLWLRRSAPSQSNG
jgi:VanZ family protein